MTELTTAGKRRRGDLRRSELADALLELLLAEGFADFTVGDLAARLRCSKTTLYGLADSKEQLVRTAVARFFQQATERVEAAVARKANPVDRVHAYLHAVADQLAPVSVRFFDDLAAFPPAAEIYERNTRAAAARVRQLIEEGVAEGVFREVHVAFAADVITSTMVRIQQRKVAAASGLTDAEAYLNLSELVLHGLMRR